MASLTIIFVLQLVSVSNGYHSNRNNVIGNILTIAEQLGATDFVKYANESGLTSLFTSPGPLTVFVPTNDAFRHLPDQLNGSLLDHHYVRSLLRYHTVNGTHLKPSFTNNKKLKSLMMEDEDYLDIIINIYQGGQVLTASGSPITNPDNKASNGVIHIVDRVMYMQPMFGNGNVATLLAALPIINYVKYAMIDGNLTQLLNGKDPYTVFAPSDVVFNQLPKEVFQKFYHNTTAINMLMKNHIVAGTHFTAGMYKNETFNTLLGQTITVDQTSIRGNTTISGAWLVLPDFTCTNGVVHVTSKVYLPPNF